MHALGTAEGDVVDVPAHLVEGSRRIGRHGLSVICQSAITPAADRFKTGGILLGNLARPARLELATSWFVVVTRKIDRMRLTKMKILTLNELEAPARSASQTIAHDKPASSN
jgi:hypothetical protein